VFFKNLINGKSVATLLPLLYVNIAPYDSMAIIKYKFVVFS